MSHPKRLLKTQASQLIEHGKIVTTHSKALKLRGYLNSLIIKTEKKDISARRKFYQSLFGAAAIKKALALPKGVKILIYKLGARSGDKAPISLIQFEVPPKQETKEKKVKTEK